MGDGNKHFVEIPLKGVMKRIRSVNKELSNLMMPLQEDHSVIMAKYKYSEYLVNHGKLCVPCGDPNCLECNELIRKRLTYSSIPLCLVLGNTVEVTEEITPNKKIPIRILNKGELFGLFEIMDHLTNLTTKAEWSVSAGSRSIFLAGKSLGSLQKELKQHSIAELNPHSTYRSLGDLVRDITTQADEWTSEVLILPGDVFKGSTSNNNAVIKYVGKQAWQQSRLLRDDRILYDQLTEMYEERGAPHVERSAKVHLLLLSTQWGDTPAYCASDALIDIIKAEEMAPIKTISSFGGDNSKVLVPCHLQTGHKGICSISQPNMLINLYRTKDRKKERSHVEDMDNFVPYFLEVNEKASRDSYYKHLFLSGNAEFFGALEPMIRRRRAFFEKSARKPNLQEEEIQNIVNTKIEMVKSKTKLKSNTELCLTDIGLSQDRKLILQKPPDPLQAFASIIGAQRLPS